MYQVTHKVVKYLNEGETCAEETRSTSIESCVQGYIARTIGCRPPWVNNEMEKACTSKVQYQAYLDLFSNISKQGEDSVAK